jgi:hypothetical protein
MADIIGVLGAATTTAIGATTVYTVPSGKAAKVKIQWVGKAGADSNGDLSFTVNGMLVASWLNLITVEFFHSTTTLLIADGSITAEPTGATAALTVAPAPFEYYLSAGDTVVYTIATTAMNEMHVQVVGTEVDIT